MVFSNRSLCHTLPIVRVHRLQKLTFAPPYQHFSSLLFNSQNLKAVPTPCVTAITTGDYTRCLLVPEFTELKSISPRQLGRMDRGAIVEQKNERMRPIVRNRLTSGKTRRERVTLLFSGSDPPTSDAEQIVTKPYLSTTVAAAQIFSIGGNAGNEATRKEKFFFCQTMYMLPFPEAAGEGRLQFEISLPTTA